MSAWTPYRPTTAAPWNRERVVHLHRRAGFAATWNEIERDLAAGPDSAVTRLLEGSSRLEGVPADFDSLAVVIGTSAADSNNPDRLKAWWLYRCLFTPHPLQERLTLMWHNHFATSNTKVESLPQMHRQNETLRTFALAPFGKLLKAVVHDPALLIWLDAPLNRKEHPNENLGRELLELFTLGVGHYTEDDVKQAARALTGWTVKQQEFFSQPAAHDDGEKEILGRIGRKTGDDLVGILLEQPATARRLAWRLANEFCGEGVVSADALDALATNLQGQQLDIRAGVETILRSELFFSPANIQTRIADPVSYLLGPLRSLECWREPPSTIVLAGWISRMGQDLFYPPNVGGWTGGRGWLSTRAVIARTNAMAALAAGELNAPQRPLDLEALAARHAGSHRSDPGQFLALLLTGRVPDFEPTPIDATLKTLLMRPQANLH